MSEVEVRAQIWGDDAPDELRSLLSRLSVEAELGSPARLVAAPPPPAATSAATGAGPEHLAVALGPGGQAAAFAAVLIAWIGSRSAAVSIELTRQDGTTVRLEAKNVRGLPRDQIKILTDQVAGLLARSDGGSAAPDSTAPDSGAPSA